MEYGSRYVRIDVIAVIVRSHHGVNLPDCERIDDARDVPPVKLELLAAGHTLHLVLRCH
jgi:hypothetical protein